MGPWCFKRQAGAGGVVCFHQSNNKRNCDVPQDNIMQIHKDLISGGFEMIFFSKLQEVSKFVKVI